MEKLKTKKETTLIFEDSYSGIEAAKRAGAKKIVVVNSMNNNYVEKNNMLIINDFREIEKFCIKKISFLIWNAKNTI